MDNVNICTTSVSGCILNIAQNLSFKLPVTLWVNNKKVQVNALVDLDVNMNFIDNTFVALLDLRVSKLDHPLGVINADRTSNKVSQITDYVYGWLEISDHESRQSEQRSG